MRFERAMADSALVQVQTENLEIMGSARLVGALPGPVDLCVEALVAVVAAHLMPFKA